MTATVLINLCQESIMLSRKHPDFDKVGTPRERKTDLGSVCVLIPYSNRSFRDALEIPHLEIQNLEGGTCMALVLHLVQRKTED